jgi:hypothetical protein
MAKPTVVIFPDKAEHPHMVYMQINQGLNSEEVVQFPTQRDAYALYTALASHFAKVISVTRQVKLYEEVETVEFTPEGVEQMVELLKSAEPQIESQLAVPIEEAAKLFTNTELNTIIDIANEVFPGVIPPRTLLNRNSPLAEAANEIARDVDKRILASTGVTAAESIPVNLNSSVKVKLTKVGLDKYIKFWNKYPTEVKDFKTLDDIRSTLPDGTHKFQLWELMSIFGSGMYNGCDIPFEKNIVHVEQIQTKGWRYKECMEYVVKTLRRNESYRQVWKANIAMAFKDEFGRHKFSRGKISRERIHNIANNAAEDFLALLCNDKSTVNEH